jgi:hypothetical protein
LKNKISLLLLLLSLFIGDKLAFAQDTTQHYIQFMGQVNDESNLPLPGVIIKNTTRSGIAISANNGQFVMVVALGDVISFSFTGFKPQKINIPTTLDNTKYIKSIILTNDTILLKGSTVHAYPSLDKVFNEPFPDTKVGDGAEIKMDHAPIIKPPNPITSPISAIANAVQRKKMKNSKGGLSAYNQSLMLKDFYKEGGTAVPDSIIQQYHK